MFKNCPFSNRLTLHLSLLCSADRKEKNTLLFSFSSALFFNYRLPPNPKPN